ncbi:hypothetical protein ACODT5_39790 [Streptomyces sp. 5.8]|uniref:hypothetical protein n=1 Tax=Streptomyces sp. 5.8 TaxID=3406571 RepID=UPI003BB63D22
MSNIEDPKVLVVDPGSGWVKAGFAGDDAPAAVVPNVIAKPDNGQAGAVGSDGYVGAQAVAKGSEATLQHPVQHGVVTDWAALERVLAHTFREELRVKPAEYSVLLAHAPGASREEREKLLELLFDRFEVRAAQIVPTNVLALHDYGRATGLVVDIGDDLTSAAAIHEGQMQERSLFRSEVAGRQVTTAMRHRLAAEGHRLPHDATQTLARQIKETIGYIAEDFETEGYRAEEDVSASYRLPDGTSISVGRARYEAPEAMFKPAEILNLECRLDGLAELVKKSVDCTDLDLRTAMVSNIAFVGGGSLLEGLSERLSLELSHLMAHVNVNVYARPERRYSAWMGGSALASTSDTSWITRSAYDEKGSAVLG